MGIIITGLIFIILTIFIAPNSSDVTNKKRVLLWIVYIIFSISFCAFILFKGTSIIKRGMSVTSKETTAVYELIPFKLESNDPNHENIYYASATADGQYSFYYEDAMNSTNSIVPMSVSESNVSSIIVTTTPTVTVYSTTYEYEMTKLEDFWFSFILAYSYTTTEYELSIPEGAIITYSEV